ncbi:putative protein phosphatase 2C 42 [Vitis vinifera]|uniref:PPM-type phosphatase domain-containing protein n=1 Tax=Vitis vinifera TaxID=29760 RepID=A0A438CRH4_VITVI|nr:putative protein phosphatase 2C 42 [Vitis vinifera]
MSSSQVSIIAGKCQTTCKGSPPRSSKKTRNAGTQICEGLTRKVRRHFHDDITVIVLFLNHDLISRGMVQDPPLSVRSALEH